MAGYHDGFFGPNISLLKSGGLWILLVDRAMRHKYLPYTCFCFVICQIYYHPTEYYMLQYAYAKLDMLVGHLGILLEHVQANFKIMSLYASRRKIIDLMNVLQSKNFQYEAAENFDPRAIANKAKSVSRRTTIGIFALCMVALGAIWASKFIQTVFRRNEDFSLGNATCYEILPYISWIPFPVNTKVLCSLAIVFQEVPMIIFTLQNISCDTLLASFLTCLQSHLDIIKGAFESVRARCLRRLGLPAKYDVLNDQSNSELEREMNAEMAKISFHLQTTITVANGVEDVFSYMTLCQITIATVVLVTCLFMASTVPIFSGIFAAQSLYFVALILQLLLYCWFGNEVTLTSAAIPASIYNSDWFSATETFKKSMLINMVRMERPIYFTIGKFTQLTLPTLVVILRGSYSYFAVLKSATNN